MKFVCFFLLLIVSKVLIEFCVCRQLIIQVTVWHIVISRGRWWPFRKTAAQCCCSAELPADKQIVVGDDKGYPEHLV